MKDSQNTTQLAVGMNGLRGNLRAPGMGVDWGVKVSYGS